MIALAYVSNAGVPQAGLVVDWESLLRVDTGAAEAAPPAWSEIGGGWYKTADWTPAQDEVGVVDLDSNAAGGLAAQDRYVPLTWLLTEGLDVPALLKRLKVVFDGDTTRTEAAGTVTHVFLDDAAATETTHALTAAGRMVT